MKTFSMLLLFPAMLLLNSCLGKYYQQQTDLQAQLAQEQNAAMKAQLEYCQLVQEKERKEIDSLKRVINSLKLGN